MKRFPFVLALGVLTLLMGVLFLLVIWGVDISEELLGKLVGTYVVLAGLLLGTIGVLSFMHEEGQKTKDGEDMVR